MVVIPQNEIKVIPKNLPNQGVVETQLPKDIIDDIWSSIDEAKKNPTDLKGELAGNIKSSLSLDMKSPLLKDFLAHILPNMITSYTNTFGVPWRTTIKPNSTWNLSSMWVNFQKQHEFNPLHDHDGIFSFVIWMRIPYSGKEQRDLPIAKESNAGNHISSFGFYYTDILGGIKSFSYDMEKNIEGYMVMFPSKLQHVVWPFYECKEERISISGNVNVI